MNVEIEKVRALIFSVLHIDPNNTPFSNTQTLSSIGCDSIDLLEICMYIEEEYIISVIDEEADRFITPEATIATVTEYLKTHY